jgi:hypothetical protein
MQFKPITAIIVLSLVVASLLVAGCTTSTTSNTNQTPSTATQTPSATPSTATQDAFLGKYLTAFENRTRASGMNFTAWKVTWINGTSARLEFSARENTSSANAVVILTKFPTTQDATNHLNTMNKTGFSLTDTQCGSSESEMAYQDAAGHALQVCKTYEYGDFGISQFDNLILETTIKPA